MIALTAAVVAAFVQEASRARRAPPPDPMLQLARELSRRIHRAWTQSGVSWHDWTYLLWNRRHPLHAELFDGLPVELLDAAGNRIVLWLPGHHAVMKIDLGKTGDGGTRREAELWELVKDDPWWTDRLVPILASGRVGDGAWSVSPAVKEIPGGRESWPGVYQLQEDLQEGTQRFRLDDIGCMNIGVHEGRYKALDFEFWEDRGPS